MSFWSDLEHRVNNSIFKYRSPHVGLANSGHTMESRYMVAEGGLTIVSLGIGGAGYAKVAAKTKPARNLYSWVKHPIANYLSRAGIDYVSRGASIYLKTSKVYRRISLAAFLANPLATIYYIRKGEYDKAVISHYGPPGSVWIYNRLKPGDPGHTLIEIERTRTPYDGFGSIVSLKGDHTLGKIAQGSKTVYSVKPVAKKPSKMPQKQKMRLWRMGLRWCKKHQRYDKCSLRPRRS